MDFFVILRKDDIAVNLADLLAHHRANEVTPKTVLIDIRRHLNKDNPDFIKLISSELTHFSS